MPANETETPGARAARYRLIAAEMRAKATVSSDDKARQIMVEVADTWDRLAAGLDKSPSPVGAPREE